MGMGCMIWQGICMSGLGTGMMSINRLRLLRLTLEGLGLIQVRFSWFVEDLFRTQQGIQRLLGEDLQAVPRIAGSTTSVSVLFCPQVNRSWSRWELPAVASTSAAHLPAPKADGTLGLEIRAPQGATVAVETTSDLTA